MITIKKLSNDMYVHDFSVSYMCTMYVCMYLPGERLESSFVRGGRYLIKEYLKENNFDQ